MAELARATGITPANIWAYFHGKKTPRPKQLERILAPVKIPLAAARSMVAWDRLLAESPPISGKVSVAPAVEPLAQGRTLRAAGEVLERTANFVRLELALLRQRPEFLWQRLSRFAPGCRAAEVRADPSFWSIRFCLWLSDASERKAADDAGEARELAELAVLVAQLLRDQQPDDRFSIRLAGRAEAFLANTLRVLGDHDLSEAGFAHAWALWKEGADKAGLLSEAQILDLEASLRRDQGRFEAALRLHDEALERARPEEEGSILLNKAGTLELIGDHAGALAAFDRAAPLIDGTRQPRLQWVLRQNQALSLIRLGRVEEARSAVAEARRRAQKLSNGLDVLRTRVVTALVDAGLGKTEAAIESLEQVCDAFRERGHAFDYALVGLDLALLYREEGRWPEIRELAGRMIEIFRERKIHRETIAAVLLFQEAAAKEAVSTELVRRLQVYLQQAQTRPGLRFVAGTGGRQKARAAE